MKGKIDIGCGSWSDADYVGVLYPQGLPPAERLACYAAKFGSVEVNSSYYATPRAEATAQWVKQTPPGFLFDIKLYRAFSRSPHKTATGSGLLGYLLEGVKPLLKAGRLGAFLLVLAPDFSPKKHGLEELDAVAEKLRPHPLAVELRHTGWIAGKQRAATFAYFRERKIAWVAVDMPRVKHASVLPPLDEVTDPRLAYLRLHGRNEKYLEAKSAAERHVYLYNEPELKELAARIRKLAREARRVRVVANNHARDFAPRTALALQKLLDIHPGG